MKPALRPVTDQLVDELTDESRDELLDAAARLGFVLVNYPTPTGQMVWEWRQGDGPRPQFVTERVAREWMSEWIERAKESRPNDVAQARQAREGAPAPKSTAETA